MTEHEKTRADIKRERENRRAAEETETHKDRKVRRPKIRIIPIWLRLLLVLMLGAAALLGGTMIGYGVIGDGQPTDVMEWSTWQHIIDLVKKTAE